MRIYLIGVIVFLCSCSQTTTQELPLNSDRDTLPKNSTSSVSEELVNQIPDSIQFLIEMLNSTRPVFERPDYSNENHLEEEEVKDKIAIDSFEFYLKRLFRISDLKKENLIYLDALISDDLQLGVVSIDENTGGSFQSVTTYTFYKTGDSVCVVKIDGTYGVSSIYMLGKSRYILIGGAATCNTCGVSTIQEIEIRNGKLDTLYFFEAGYRHGFINDFSYDTLTRTFRYDYYGYCVDSGAEGEELEACREKGEHKFK